MTLEHRGHDRGLSAQQDDVLACGPVVDLPEVDAPMCRKISHGTDHTLDVSLVEGDAQISDP